MRKPGMTPDAFPHRGTAAPFRVAIGLALAVSAGMMLWGVGTPFASESTVTLEDRVAALTAELAQVKAETAKLRESQGDTSEELSHMRASLANAEIGLGALRTTIDDYRLPVLMLWTAPPPARECQGCGGCLRLPRFGGATYAVDFDNWSRYCQVGLSSAWR